MLQSSIDNLSCALNTSKARKEKQGKSNKSEGAF